MLKKPKTPVQPKATKSLIAMLQSRCSDENAFLYRNLFDSLKDIEKSHPELLEQSVQIVENNPTPAPDKLIPAIALTICGNWGLTNTFNADDHKHHEGQLVFICSRDKELVLDSPLKYKDLLNLIPVELQKQSVQAVNFVWGDEDDINAAKDKKIDCWPVLGIDTCEGWGLNNTINADDGKHHPEHLVLLTDWNPFGENGEIAFEYDNGKQIPIFPKKEPAWLGN